MENQNRPKNASTSQLSVEQLGMEVATELGIDPASLSARGLTEQQIRQYEAQLHSGNRNQNSGR